MRTKNHDTAIAKLLRALEGAEITLKRINVKNEQAAEMSLSAMKEAGVDINSKWPGGLFEDIAEAAQGRARLCRQAITDANCCNEPHLGNSIGNCIAQDALAATDDLKEQKK